MECNQKNKRLVNFTAAIAFSCLLMAPVFFYTSLTVTATQRQRTNDAAKKRDQARKSEIAELLQQGNVDQAESLARTALKDSPRDADLHNLLGVALDQRGQASEAESEYRRALELDPKSAPVHVNLGVLLARTNRPSLAITALEEALSLAPDNPQAVVNLGLLYSATGNFSRAIELLEQAVAKSGNDRKSSDLPILLALTRDYFALHRTNDALPLANEIQQLAKDDARVLYTLGLQFAEAQEYEGAVTLFEKTNAIQPNRGEIQYNLGVALYNLNRLDEASRALQAAAALLPNDPDPF
jgi:Flp pilus assembly protein TadD